MSYRLVGGVALIACAVFGVIEPGPLDRVDVTSLVGFVLVAFAADGRRK